MTIRGLFAAALLSASFILAGCATSRSEVSIASPLDAPAASAKATPAAAANGKTVLIRSVTDERVFEEKPRDPATPSLGFGGAAAATAEIKARAIGRKRNGYGAAMGDVLLDEGQTVADIVKDNLVAAFRQAGYQVAASQAEAGASPIVVDARIKKLWEYFTPGFWAVSVTINVETDLQVAGVTAPVTIAVNRVDRGMMVTDNGYKTNLEGAMVEYRKKLSEKLNQAPF